MRFDSNELGVGWLSVALAASDDDTRPALCRTVYVEQYQHGVRLVATDSFIILRTWVPGEGYELDPEPRLDEAPLSTAVVIDPDRRGQGLLKHARKLWARAMKEESTAWPTEITLDLGVIVVEDEDADGQPAFVGMEPKWAVIEIPGAERVKLPLYEGEFPNWRTLFSGPRPATTTALALAPDMMKRLGQLGALHPADALIGCEFTGENKPVLVKVINGTPHVSGLAMPCRWDFETNSPWVPPSDDDQQQIEAA